MTLLRPGEGYATAHGIDRNEDRADDLLELLAGRRPSWWQHAACVSAPADVNFYPVQGESLDPARAVCASCTTRVACLADALEHDDTDGVRAGFSGRDRARLRRAAGTPLEVAAAAIAAAEVAAADRARYAASMREAGPVTLATCQRCPMAVKVGQALCKFCAEPEHGDLARYQAGCRCRDCRAAQAEWRAERKQEISARRAEAYRRLDPDARAVRAGRKPAA